MSYRNIWAAAAAIVAALAAAPLQAQQPEAKREAPVVDRSTSCGQAARGYRADGSGKVVELDAAAARSLRVNADGVWEQCQPTPNRGCGQGGSGYMAGRGIVDMLPEEAGGWKIDSAGVWKECAPCMPAEPEAFRTWAVGPYTCTTARAHDSDPNSRARNRVLRHGEASAWSQWIGSMRGQLIESCSDGQRTVVAATCQPATGCDHNITAWRGGVRSDGQETRYTYNGAGEGREVPNGAGVALAGDDGTTWPATCRDGEWAVPVSLPVEPPKPAPVRPKLIGCGSQTISARVGLQTLSYWRYSGPRVALGETVNVRSTNGGATANAQCGPGGKLQLR